MDFICTTGKHLITVTWSIGIRIENNPATPHSFNNAVLTSKIARMANNTFQETVCRSITTKAFHLNSDFSFVIKNYVILKLVKLIEEVMKVLFNRSRLSFAIKQANYKDI
jgi:hypothetical protein